MPSPHVTMSQPDMTVAAPLYSNQHLLDHDWGTVTTAWLQKFPDPALQQVTAVETVGRTLSEADQTLHVRRLFQCTFPIPAVVERILGKRAQVVCVEEAHWDLQRRRLIVHGRNETLQSVLLINEVCCFTEVAPGQTLYTQSATVTYRRGLLSGLLMPMVNNLLAGTCQKTAHKGLCALVARAQREASGDVLPAELQACAEGSVQGGRGAAYGLPALGLLAVGLSFGLYGLPRIRLRPDE
mmetsp:Transcript_71123/g.230165  ORF Transcript_71123/g.230165 Transcript_71123/m.230165 type:complete len:240 (-) Transcript_71123:255-974(-)